MDTDPIAVATESMASEFESMATEYESMALESDSMATDSTAKESESEATESVATESEPLATAVGLPILGIGDHVSEEETSYEEVTFLEEATGGGKSAKMNVRGGAGSFHKRKPPK